MLTKLQEWPRTPFVREPTPLIQAPNLAQLIDRAPADVLLKMDAETGFGLGGNKARKLEFELAPGRLKGATHVITCGGPQSNHARLTAAAAAMLDWAQTGRIPPQDRIVLWHTGGYPAALAL